MIAPEKLAAFNEWAGAAHGLMPGAIRTYKTGVNFRTLWTVIFTESCSIIESSVSSLTN